MKADHGNQYGGLIGSAAAAPEHDGRDGRDCNGDADADAALGSGLRLGGQGIDGGREVLASLF
jgi:hypothetical protein